MGACPAPLASGSVRAIERACAYWAFRIVKHTARGLPWNRCLALIQNRQQAAENAVDVAQAKLLEDTVERGDGVGDIAVAAARAELDKLNKRIVADWWELNDELLVRFGDGPTPHMHKVVEFCKPPPRMPIIAKEARAA